MKDYLGGCVLDGYYGDERTWTPNLWRELISLFGVGSVLDIGCGGGYSLRWFKEAGLSVTGLEAYDPALAVLAEMGSRDDVIEFDFTKDSPSRLVGPLDGKWDMGWCCEVVEHVDERHMETLLGVFSKCRLLAMTHAVPGQSGHHHVNCQDREYWVEKLESCGFEYLPQISEKLRRVPEDFPIRGYYSNRTLLVFSESDKR